MNANGAYYVAECPLSSISLCHWTSAPETSEEAATEALRAHLGGAGNGAHSHGDLVTFAAAHLSTITKYRRETEVETT